MYLLRQPVYAPHWVVVKHYGWRIPLLSMFPNALAIRDAEGPEESLLPWFNVVLLSMMALILGVIWRIGVILGRRFVDPVIVDIDGELDEAGEAISRRYRGARGFFRRLLGR